jgi:magnesium-transporting ATPase (P-type)
LLALRDDVAGPEFRARVHNKDGSLNFAEFMKIAPRLRVMARCSPTDKYTLVKGRYDDVVVASA